MTAIAECFGVHYSTVSRAVSAHEAGARRGDPRVAGADAR
jgi:DNA-directed RNA polymerase specialized sigma54-like protein